ncbi:MAG: transcriptional regulator NrdR [Proteobacteria bacterium]|nr:transcriptional regulator NrdR [Pseudomonadota bacterium]
MRCPECGHEDTRVLESRLSHEGRSVRRRRNCPDCNHRFTTYEREEDFLFQIKKRDGRIEAYTRDKALKSLQVACQKRPISLDQLESLLAKIERTIQDEGERVVPSEKLGGMILERLTELDKVAYVRFASVYKDFKDTDQFMRELVAIDRSGLPIPPPLS